MSVRSELLKRNLPPLPKSRAEGIGILSDHIYGRSPAAPADVRAKTLSSEKIFGGKGLREEILLSFDTPAGEFSFPFAYLSPAGVRRPWLFVFLNFRPDIPDRYFPAEELLDSGFAVARIYYQDITSDSADPDGLWAMFPRRNDGTDWGKIGMWAYGASRVLDWALENGRCHDTHAAVIGHSRLGKTALWCAAQDLRFSLACSNNAGCSGDAVTRGKGGEHVAQITERFPFWFCEKYRDYAQNEENMPFDQHTLLSMIAPRLLCIGAAKEDAWADPESQFLACAAASDRWEALGAPGLCAPDRQPIAPERLFEGGIGYFLRDGSHALTRTDWKNYISFWRMNYKKSML